MIYEVWREGAMMPGGRIPAEFMGRADGINFGDAAATVVRELKAIGKDIGDFDATALTLRGRKLFPDERAARAAFG